MATSAFKSTSRRSTADQTPKKSGPLRRSRSVSSLSRTSLSDHVISEFLNKRDNPLFCTSTSPPQEPRHSSRERGRSVARNSDAEVAPWKAGVGGRRQRSVSRSHYVASKSDAEQDFVISSHRGQNVNIVSNGLKKGSVSDDVSNVRTAIVKRQSPEPSVNSAPYLERQNWEDGVSSGSLTEAEEKTIKAVYEQMKGEYVEGALSPSNGIYETVRSEVRRAISDIQSDLESAIQRNNTHATATTNVANIPPDLVNPGAVELVTDIRKEYAKKLEESQERASKLRAELAVEEHRGQEFCRILKEVIPDPKTNNFHKSRPGRRRSNERNKMSNRLTEEAMAYFDECVSISTFDNSDFSAPEDPLFSSVGASTPMGPTTSFMPHSSNSSLSHNQDFSHSVLMNNHTCSGLTVSSSSNEPVINKELGRKSRFSFSHKPTENGTIRRDISSYIKSIGKECDETTSNQENLRTSYCDIEVYKHPSGESLLLEMVKSKNQMERGSLHLCGGGLAMLFPPFASVI